MSKKLSFEDTFKKNLSDLPTGNEDASWQKMKELLEEKEKRKPFAWLNVYTVCSCIIIIAGFGISMILFNSSNKQKSLSKKVNTLVEKKNDTENEQSNLNKPSALRPGKTNKFSQKNNTDEISKQKTTTITELNSTHNNHYSLNKNNSTNIFYKRSFVEASKTKNKSVEQVESNTSVSKKENNNAIVNSFDSLQNKDDNLSISKNNPAKERMKSALPAIVKNDSVTIQNNAPNNLKQPPGFDTTSIKKQTPISFKQKQFFVEAGLQFKQQIPLNGQQITAYNYTGNKELFKDYIPSFFVRFEKDRQWFLQAEFSYATPYFIKQFSYSRQTKADYALSTITTTNINLQKTYYTKVPVSFNYYIQPHWLIGTGIIYNWFHGAVAEQETTINDIKKGAVITAKQIIPFKNFTDSFLYKNQASLLLQTGYSLKRWSFILRYEKGVQPYIKYTLANGTIESKKNSSVELNIDFRLFKKPF